MLARTLATAGLIATLAAPAALAQTMPNSDDGIIVWRNFQLTGPADSPRNDVHIYFVKQWWFTPTVGLYAFYGTQQTATVRLQGKLPIGGRTLEDGTVVPPWMTLTGMAGYRAVGMGSSLAAFSANFREGPEVAGSVAVPLGYNLSASANLSYATMFSAANAPASLVFYGGNLNWQFRPDTGVAAGVLGVFLAPVTGGLTFHDLGPTLTVSHKF
jgi:hypothetical protein